MWKMFEWAHKGFYSKEINGLHVLVWVSFLMLVQPAMLQEVAEELNSRQIS